MFARVVPTANRLRRQQPVDMQIDETPLPETYEGRTVPKHVRKAWIAERKRRVREHARQRRKQEARRKRILKRQEKRHPKWPDNCYGRAQRKTHYAFDPSTTSGRILNGLVILLVIISVMTFMIETMPQFYSNEPTKNEWFWIETSIVAIFTIELGLRFWASPAKIDFCKNWLNIIDFLAIAPYYFELVVQTGVSGFQVIRIIRLARIVRLFKLARFTAIVAVLKRGMIAGKEGLYLMIFFLFLSLILFASVIYYAENSEATWEDDDDALAARDDFCEFGCWIYDEKRGGGESPFQSIPASLWWAVVTQTTVGYGDVFPVTPAGKTVAAISYVFAIVMMAYPVAILSEAFLEEYMNYQAKSAPIVKRKAASLLAFNQEETLQKLVDELEWEVKLSKAALEEIAASTERLIRSFLLFTPGKHTMNHEIAAALQAAKEKTESSHHVQGGRDAGLIGRDDV